MNVRVGVLAIQGSFPLHAKCLERCGASLRFVRRPDELAGLDGLVIPGGESSVMSLLAESYGLMSPLRELGVAGLPMFGTCAGAILLGRGEDHPPRLGLAPVEVDRNAYGRQVDSFTAEVEIENESEPFHGIFIRAPKLRISQDADVEILGRQNGEPVLLRHGRLLLATFHPELTEDVRIHELFLRMCRDAESSSRD